MEYQIADRLRDKQTGLVGRMVGYNAEEQSKAIVVKVDGSHNQYLMADPIDFEKI
jgi:hypothetical protein